MATFKEVAREAGLNPMLCPHCGRHFSTNNVIKELFRRVLAYIVAGHEVRISHLGTFVTKIVKGRTLRTPIMEGGEVTYGDRKVLTFKQTKAVKGILNGKDEPVKKGKKS